MGLGQAETGSLERHLGIWHVPSSAAFPGSLAESCNREEQPGLNQHSDIRCWRSRQWLNLLRYNACLLVLYLNSLPHQKSFGFHSMLFSRSFILLLFTFTSVTHIELIFVKGVMSVCGLVLFICDCPAPFVENSIFFSFVLFLLLCQISIDCVYVSPFLGSLFNLWPVSYCLDYYSFIINLEVSVSFLTCASQYYVDYFGCFVFPCKLELFADPFTKWLDGIFWGWHCVCSSEKEYWHFDNIDFLFTNMAIYIYLVLWSFLPFFGLIFLIDILYVFC